MKSDLELFNEFDTTSSYANKAYNTLSLINNAIGSGVTIELLDLAKCRLTCNDVLDYLEVKQRFLILRRQANDKLVFANGKFKLYDTHEFSSLDEVEKAIKNKAFL